MTALAFLAGVVVGVVVGVCGLIAVSLTMFSSRLSRREERAARDRRPFDDRRPGERHR